MTRAQVLILSTSSSITGNGSQFPLPGAVEHQTDTLKSMLDNRLLGLEFKSEDFERLKEVGFGSAGVVYHARYSPSDLYLALKIIRVVEKELVLKRVIQELNVLKTCQSCYIVSYYGAYLHQGEIHILMEYMDCGSLDKICKLRQRVPEKILGRIIHDVLQGLSYLRNQKQVIHRDIKPSNILLNSSGDVKICDFGVSGTLTNSIAETFVGTHSYMAPERLQGKNYSIRSDIWSIGILMVEMSIGIYPYPPMSPEQLKNLLSGDTEPQPSQELCMTFYDVLCCVENGEPTMLCEPFFSSEIVDFVSKCLVKNPAERSDLSSLLCHEYINKHKDLKIETWTYSLRYS